ncbi:MAG: hypothetical protein HON90_05915 [Halobacteriovoraceae bacterium]|nr:hypothetical protein [Halobacteriovoraceae bacterium]
MLGVLKAILSSDIDADRIDYLQRDSLSCGIKISAIDFNHILNSIQINSDKNGEFFIELKKNAISSIDQVLISRKMMFDRVYLHWEHCYYGDLLINCIKKLNITSRVEKLTSSWREYVFANDDQVDESIRIYIKSIKNVKEISDDNLKALLYFYRIKPKKHFQSLYFSSEHKEKKGELLEKYSQSLFEILPIPLKKFTSLARDLNSDKDSILRINLLNDGDFVVYNKASDIFKSNLWIQIKERATVVDSLSEIKIKKLDEIEKIHSSLFLDVTAKKKDVG